MAVRPPWRVAGVDYRVGIDVGVTLKPITDFTTDHPEWASIVIFDGTLIRMWKSGGGAPVVTFDGYDFTGYTIYCSNVDFICINCKSSLAGWVIMRHDGGEDNSGSCTLTNCEVDGTGMSALDYNRYIYMRGEGTLTMRYCWIHNIANHGVEYQGQAGSGAPPRYDVKYCLFDEFSDSTTSSDVPPSGVHTNFWQCFGGSSNDSSVLNFNTWKQHVNYEGGQGIQLSGTNSQCNNNTCVIYDTGPGGTGSAIAAMFDAGHAGENYTGEIKDNYIYRAGIRVVDGFSVFYPSSLGVPAVSGNIDMQTGAIITADD